MKYLLTALLAATALSCSSGHKIVGPVNYSATARQNYRKGVRAMRKRNYEEAKKYFKYVRNKFVLSKYVVLAELRSADLLFKQGKYLSAIDAYQTFLKEHPGHQAVQSGYVPFKIGYSHWKMVPSDWWLLPPSYEKDLTPVLGAAKVFRRFLERFGESKYAGRARKYYHKALRKLARHELYVAKFYLSRGKPKGAILRLEGLVRRYPDAGYEPSVLLLLAKTHLKMKHLGKARATFSLLIRKYPTNSNAARARLYLKYMDKTFGRPRRPTEKMESKGS